MRSLLVYVFFAFILFYQCKSEDSFDSETTELEQAYESEANAENGIKLINKYLSLIPSLSDNRNAQLELLKKGHPVSKDQQLFAQTVQFLTALVKEDQNANETPGRIVELVQIMNDVLNREQAGRALKLSFIQAYPDHEAVNGDENHTPLLYSAKVFSGQGLSSIDCRDPANDAFNLL